MKIKFLSIAFFVGLLTSCSTNETATDENVTPEFTNRGHELVYNMVQKTGTYQMLLDKKDVVYTYTYEMPDGQTDISTEKYIFDGELSRGSYHRHERTFPEMEGLNEQGYDGTEYWLKSDGKIIDDEKSLKIVKFKRPTNFYWFAMMPKLLDPGLNYEDLGEKTIDGITYDVVKVSFNSEKPTDIYQVYINQETGLVDQFLFTVVDFGVDIPRLMKLEYETVDGLLIPTKRKYKKSNWDAEDDENPWIKVTWSDIKFDNGLTKEEFKKNH